MSVRVNISRVNGKIVFDDPNPSQSDLVFWRNGDSVTHWPVPGCSGLQVAPGATSAPYQAVPPTFPSSGSLAIVYGCAIPGHESESGTLTVLADVPAPAPVMPGGTPSTRTVTISRSGGTVVFPEVDAAQIDKVVWTNDDTETHWPVPNCTGLKVDPGAVSNDMHPSPPPGAPTVPLTVAYGCAIDGHEAEHGTINLYGTLVAPPPPGAPPIPSPLPAVAISQTQPYAPVPIAVGGKSPYQPTDDPAYPFLKLVETAPAGSSTGVSLILTAAPLQTGNLTYTLNITDSMGSKITNQNVAITIGYGALTALASATIFTQVQPYVPVPVATGGQSPFTMTGDSAYPCITLVETAPAGSSTGVSAILNSAPRASDIEKGSITYSLSITDAAGNSFPANTTIQIILI